MLEMKNWVHTVHVWLKKYFQKLRRQVLQSREMWQFMSMQLLNFMVKSMFVSKYSSWVPKEFSWNSSLIGNLKCKISLLKPYLRSTTSVVQKFELNWSMPYQKHSPVRRVPLPISKKKMKMLNYFSNSRTIPQMNKERNLRPIRIYAKLL